MRSQLAKTVKKKFEAELRQRAPQFVPTASQEIPGGCRLFRWSIAPDFATFLLLVIARDDRFTVEGAWSRDGQFPALVLPGNPGDVPAERICDKPPKDQSMRFRVARLYEPRGDPWWELVPKPSAGEFQVRLDRLAQGIIDEPPLEEALQRVGPLVEDCVCKVQSFAIPYFVAVASALGHLSIKNNSG